MAEALSPTRTELSVQDGVIVGPLRQSVNRSKELANSIHNDAVATKLGFKGGTVAGSIHMELFPPLLLEAFGPRWFERGTLSTYFLNATTDREVVRAFVRQPNNGHSSQVELWVEREDGMRVLEGTASVGDSSAPSALLQRLEKPRDPSVLRMFKDLKPGDTLPAVEVRVEDEQQAKRMDVITEPLTWYENDSPWGRPIATPAAMTQLLYAQWIEPLRPNVGGAVGLFGAIEHRFFNGPLFVGHTYTVSGKFLMIGQSPKTEYLWFETVASDNDKPIAGMLMLLRFMKTSSSLYREAG